MEEAFTRSSRVILDHFNVDLNKGLTPSQVKAGLERYGKNGNVAASRYILYIFVPLDSLPEACC